MKPYIKDTEAGSGFINRWHHSGAFFFLLFFIACSSTPLKPSQTPSPLTQGNESGAFRVGPYTKLSISVYNEPELTEEVTVLPEGTIDYAYLGKIDVKGLTLPQIEKKITTALSDYLVYPRVDVRVREMGIIYVFGSIKNPGIMTLREQQTPLEVIADAGGFSSRAQKKSVEVVRTIAGEKKSFTLSFRETKGGGLELLKTFYLQPGDTVIVE